MLLAIFQLLPIGRRWMVSMRVLREAPFKRVLRLLTFNLRLRSEHARWPISHTFHPLLLSEEYEECGVSVVSFHWIRMIIVTASVKLASTPFVCTYRISLCSMLALIPGNWEVTCQYLCIGDPNNCCCLYDTFCSWVILLDDSRFTLIRFEALHKITEIRFGVQYAQTPSAKVQLRVNLFAIFT